MFLGTPRGHKGVDDLAARGRRGSGGRTSCWRVVGADPDGATARRLRAIDARGPRGRAGPVRRGARPSSRRPTWSPCPSATPADTRGQVPAKLFDAMALGRPIVSTRVSMIPEILEGCGALVPPGDVGRARRGHDAAPRRSPPRRAALGARARARCVERYSFAAARAHAAPPAAGPRRRAVRIGAHLPAVLVPRRRRDRHGRAHGGAGPARIPDRAPHDRRAGPRSPASRSDGSRSWRGPRLAPPALVRLRRAPRAGRAGTYDVVQSHERGLAQDVYRAGEGTHRGYLEATGRRGLVRVRITGRSSGWSGGSSASGRRGTSSRSRGAAAARSARLYGTPPRRR